MHLANVNNDRWVDADALFAYYNDAYFEGRLSEVTFSWVNREEEDGEYRYCLCSAVPGWWHGEHKNLCAACRAPSSVVEAAHRGEASTFACPRRCASSSSRT